LETEASLQITDRPNASQ